MLENQITDQDKPIKWTLEDQALWDTMQLLDDEPLATIATIVTEQTKHSDITFMLERFANSPTFKKGRQEAEKIIAKATTVGCFSEKPAFNNPELSRHFEIKQPKITAVIDFLTVKVTASDSYQFRRPQMTFKDVQDFLDAKGIVKRNSDGTGGAYVQHSKTNVRCFTFNVYDIKTGEQFNQIVNLIKAEYSPKSIKIIGAELSLDFWHLPASPLLLELSKSVRADTNTERKDFRIYKNKYEYGEMPATALSAINRLEKGFVIGIGHREKGDKYKRFYYKTRDGGKDLPIDQHRPRAEVNLREELLRNISNDVADLRKIITEGFKHLHFTKLSDKATKAEAKQFHSKVDLYGRETEIISKSRNKRSLPEYMKTNADLNKVINKSVQNLARHF